ncbi:DUF2017 domain-containing protein [Embleya sp. NBC_00896]|uniref:DUF2017 domain-containing protein n=1 Tax=Embleya sp. NBC_00896 TaxID=2975961 RepID=UPI0038695087|nr:DUF2017 domain-containing protein [Embleya sp. NBC_00896]
MNGLFSRGRSGKPEIVLEDMHVRVLADLCGQLMEMVSPDDDEADPLAAELGLTGLGSTEVPSTPDDPALARLLPDAYPEDAEAAAEFRRYTETDLRLRKRDNARIVLADLAELIDLTEPADAAELREQAGEHRVVLDPQGVQAWLGALNDLRLVIGTRLEVTEDMEEFEAKLAEDDPRRWLFAVFHWLGGLQDSLLGSL